MANFMLYRDHISDFYSCKLPTISLYNYINRLIDIGKFNQTEITIALIYLDRLKLIECKIFDTNNIHLLFAVSLLLAEKWHTDDILNMNQFAKLFGIKFNEILLIENHFVKKMEWKFHVTKNEFEEKVKLIQNSLNMKDIDRRESFILILKDYLENFVIESKINSKKCCF